MNDMMDLYKIMDDLLILDYKQETEKYILKILEGNYQEETKAEVKMVVSHFVEQIENDNKRLKCCIKELDQYIARNAAK